MASEIPNNVENPKLNSISVPPLMNLTLAHGMGDKNDCYVLDDGRRIGRIFLSPHAPDGRPWFWGIFPPPAGNEGYAATQEECDAIGSNDHPHIGQRGMRGFLSKTL